MQANNNNNEINELINYQETLNPYIEGLKEIRNNDENELEEKFKNDLDEVIEKYNDMSYHINNDLKEFQESVNEDFNLSNRRDQYKKFIDIVNQLKEKTTDLKKISKYENILKEIESSISLEFLLSFDSSNPFVKFIPCSSTK